MSRLQRLDDDQRAARVWALGGVAYDQHRAARIAQATDWAWLLCPVDDLTRRVYRQFVVGAKPLSSITGIVDGKPFHATREDLEKLWRVDRRRSA